MILEKKGLIVANWKMNHSHLEAISCIQKLSYGFDQEKAPNAEVVVCPSFTSLRSIQTVIEADKMPISIGAQDVSQHNNGSYTGDVSAQMLEQLHVKYVIIGHSERRKNHNETDDLVLAKTKQALKFNLKPIVCVGELTRGDDLLKVQLESIKPFANDVVVAYEPAWAIGTGTSAPIEHIQESISSIVNTIGQETTVLYGASANIGNAKSITDISGVGGLLVGGASLDGDGFAKLVYAAIS
jgi:triosephosphate isomerase